MASNKQISNPWDIDDALFPKFGTRGDKLSFMLQYAVLAHSVLNTQPWHFKIKHDTAEIHIDHSKQLQQRDPDLRQALLSCGAAVGNLIVASRYFGYEPNVNLLTGKLNSSLVATIALGALVEPSSEMITWFENMTQLELGLTPYRKGPLPATLTPTVARVAKNYRVRVKNIEHQEKAITKIAETAIERESSDPAFQKELVDWLRTSGADSTDGLPASFFGIGGLGTLFGRRWLGHLTSGKGQLKTYRQLFSSCAGGFILNTESDNPDLCLEAGIVLQQSLLAIRSQGLLPILCQPIMDLDKVRQDLGLRFCDERSPQALVLYGWAKKQGVRLPKRAFDSFFETADA